MTTVNLVPLVMFMRTIAESSRLPVSVSSTSHGLYEASSGTIVQLYGGMPTEVVHVNPNDRSHCFTLP
jgi:hypothetical protein